MNKTIVSASFAILLLLLLCFTTTTVSAQTQTVPIGVSEGDTFTYDLHYLWSSTNPQEAVPPNLQADNQTDYFQIKVQTITGSTVTLNTIWKFLNGTQITQTNPSEVSTGITGGIYVYTANLTAGNLLFPLSTELPFVINQTVPRLYPSGERATNHIAVNNTNIEGKAYSYMDLYFDQQTGMLVEYYLTEVNSATPSQTVTQHILIKDSNVWAIPELSPLLLLPMFIAAAAIAIVLQKKNPVA